VEEIVHKNVRFSAWDLGGQERIRSIWSTYYSRTDAVLFVIDSTDIKSEVIAKTELFKIVINEVLLT
jgi:GTPase SAR1 family protein